MHSGDTRDIKPGISAVLAVCPGQPGLEAAVLDLGAVLDGLVADNFEILVVEFGTAKPTPNVLVDLAARSPNLPLHVLPRAYPDRNSALGAGLETSCYDLLLVTTADGQFDVLELNHLLESIERGADLAIGYRHARADGVVHRLVGWLHTAALKVLYGQTLRDVDCEFKLFRRVVWERMRPRPRGMSFNAELLVRARRLGFVIDEVPVSHRRPRRQTVTGSPPVSVDRRAA